MHTKTEQTGKEEAGEEKGDDDGTGEGKDGRIKDEWKMEEK